MWVANVGTVNIPTQRLGTRVRLGEHLGAKFREDSHALRFAWAPSSGPTRPLDTVGTLPRTQDPLCLLFTKSWLTLCNLMNCSPPGSPCPVGFPRQNTGWVCMPSSGRCGQGLNLYLLQLAGRFLPLSHLEAPRVFSRAMKMFSLF